MVEEKKQVPADRFDYNADFVPFGEQMDDLLLNDNGLIKDGVADPTEYIKEPIDTFS